MAARDLAGAARRQRRAEQIISCFRGGFIADLAGARDLCDGFQARPLMAFLQPADVRRDGDGAGFDAAMIGVDRGVVCRGLGQRIVEKHLNVFVKRCLIALERKGVIAALIDDLLGDRTLTVERVASY